ncbi:hypothetical protein BU23DRAFT_76560 [Bimuria novae-zelandiae CBS 107.79]|uniref:Uncharacterized protein n=1 Tax=Bimuria novae-zelandiae CBS 107.79 TaxID=1447943 RepID=A0A6A5VDI7_9PLEO|nr:hypothetical protein BU23DRAFT_76560 [Bimuria novae-zelandiae CBS 107.79]
MAHQVMPQQVQHDHPASRVSAPVWQTNGLPRDVNGDSAAPAVDQYPSAAPLTGTSAPSGAYHSMMASTANAYAYSLNHGLPMASPMIVPNTDFHGGAHSHFDCSSMSEGRPTVVKSERSFMDGQSWPLPMQQSIMLQPGGATEGSDMNAGASSSSPRSSYFSEPSDCDTTFSPRPTLGEMNANSTWAGNVPASPVQIKQSSSQENSPRFPPSITYPSNADMGAVMAFHSATYGNRAFVQQSRNGSFGLQIGQLSFPWTGSMGQNENLGMTAWNHSAYPPPQRPTPQGYYAQNFAVPFLQHTTDAESTIRAGTTAQTIEQGREAQPNLDRQVVQSSGRPADEQRQRERENEILKSGKAAGLTYKEIKLQIGPEAPAESTLRGRWRAMSKQRKDRVRKPVWKSQDVR